MSKKIWFFWKGPLSQWYPSPFKADGVAYSCAEQYMMAEKARLFDDEVTLSRIMATSNPRDQKKLGRKVKGFDQKTWDEKARDIVYKGNYAKFTQNQELLDSLMSTGDAILAEASPYDTIWGIGLSEDDCRAQDQSRWRGMNWLGEVLMKVRNDLVG